MAKAPSRRGGLRSSARWEKAGGRGDSVCLGACEDPIAIGTTVETLSKETPPAGRESRGCKIHYVPVGMNRRGKYITIG